MNTPYFLVGGIRTEVMLAKNNITSVPALTKAFVITGAGVFRLTGVIKRITLPDPKTVMHSGIFTIINHSVGSATLSFPIHTAATTTTKIVAKDKSIRFVAVDGIYVSL
jgi:hypothetical protein